MKCEACGTLPATYVELVPVVSDRWSLTLCRQCLTEINAKNPDLRAALEREGRLRKLLAKCRKGMRSDFPDELAVEIDAALTPTEKPK